MWLLIEVKKQEDIGIDEITRVRVKGVPRVTSAILGWFHFKFIGVKVHPATKE